MRAFCSVSRQTDGASIHSSERVEIRAELETFTQEKTRLQRLVSRLRQSLGRLFDKLQSIAMGRSTVLDYVPPEAQPVVDDLNELDNEEYEL